MGLAAESTAAGGSGRREQLLDAALEVFAAEGFSRARVSDVVSRAGVAQGTFYLYFRSKRELLLALVERFCETLTAAVQSRPVEPPRTPDEFRRQAVGRTRDVLRVAVQNRALAALFMQEAVGGDPDLEARLRRFHADMAAYTARDLEAAMAAGFIRPVQPRLAAYAITGMWERVLTHCVLLEPGPHPIDELAEELISLQLDGLRPRPS